MLFGIAGGQISEALNCYLQEVPAHSVGREFSMVSGIDKFGLVYSWLLTPSSSTVPS